MQIEITKGFTQKTCGTCGVVHFIPDELEQECKNTGQAWYCPNGHSRVYKETEADKYKRLYEQTEQYRKNAVESAQRLQSDLEKCQAKTKKPQRKKITK